uniref:DUF305 domain-containing protein n=1 Tax=Timspurckia oligopyrenoides TaxID=708627 RepID=A0A7S0ZAP7_9RHOD|mmetsp:Transcript_10493/g.18928  ORF Transcript_10493/g.18928 Transcript_10493/m.18928 type:complete len:268 (+) Transcript_10493:2-805(+)
MVFVCNQTGLFGECMSALDCAMHEEMRTTQSDDNRVTFVDQMIPHHLNAVNMAKALLKANAEDLDEEFTNLLWEIINTQNMQVTYMRKFLESQGLRDGDHICGENMCQSHDTDGATVTPESSPTPTPAPACIEAEWIEMRGLEKVHAHDGIGELLCIVGLDMLPCGTPDHVLELSVGLRTYAEVCAERECFTKTARFNGVLHADSHLLPSQFGVRLTTVTHRGSVWSGIENRVVVSAQKVGSRHINAALTYLQQRSTQALGPVSGKN